MTAGAPPPRIVYILAVQNSGSTALDAVLGSATSCTGVGEMAGFGRLRDVPPRPCDCERAGPWCDPCRAVEDALDAAPSAAPWPEELGAVLGGRHLGWTVVGTAGRRRYAGLSFVALDAAAAATGAAVVVDSSKNVARAAALLADPDRDVRVVHLVRDPRSYLRSRERRAERLGHSERRVALLLHWVVKNGLAATVIRARAGRRYLRVHFEDLVDSPATELARIGRHIGVDLGEAAVAAVGPGVERSHLYEPSRAVDYRRVRLDPEREASGGAPEPGSWGRGGFVGALFGYRRGGRR